MIIRLRQLAADLVKPARDYGAKVLATHARRLRPEAADSFLADLAADISVTDMWRSATSGLAAIKAGKGSRSPGYSGHNYGISIDIGVTEAMRRLGFKRKADLDAWMRERNWWCWRLDGRREREEWHYDWNRGGYDRKADTRGDQGLQRQLVDLHGPDFALTVEQAQRILDRLGFDPGPADGKPGRRTRAATGAFQRAWMPFVTPTEKLGPPTQRVLAFVGAEYQLA